MWSLISLHDIFAGDFNAFHVSRYAYFNIFKGLEGRSYGPGANIFHLCPIPGVKLDLAMFRTRAILREKRYSVYPHQQKLFSK